MEGSVQVTVIESLLDLQRTDGQIREAEREARDIPQRIAQENARLNGVNAALEIAKSQLAAMRTRIRSEESEGEEIRSRIQQLKVAQVQIQSNKEMQQSINQIATLEANANAAENRAITLAEDSIPTLEDQVKAAQERVDASRGGVDGYVAELEERLAGVKAELVRLNAERESKVTVIRQLDPRAALAYERLRTKRWPVVVLLNSDCVCDGCHMKQPPFVEQMVQHNKGIVACTMCGRILYRDL